MPAPRRSPSAPRAAGALLTALLTAVLALLPPAAASAATPAAATAPARLATQLQDTAGVLDDGARSSVQQALDSLYASDRLRLWVVYVDSFDGTDRTTWAAQTRRLSDLGPTDVVLGVAVTDRSYYLDTTGVSAVSAGEQEALQTDRIEPALRSGDWAGAAEVTATGIAAAVGASGSGGSLLGPVLVGLALLLLLGGALLWARRRRHGRDAARAEAALRVDGTDRDALGRLPVTALRARAERAVTGTDDAVRASREELTLATDELGASATSGFARALADAEHALARAMATRQVLDDDVPETDEQARTMLVELVVAATTADRALDEQAERFRGARDLLVNGSDRVEALVRALVTARVRLEGSTATLARLRRDFPAPALAPVDDNVELATEHLALVEAQLEVARTALARPAGEQGALVDAVRTAEAALGQTTALLDGVDHAATDIPHARATLPEAVADAERGVARARELAAQAPATARPGPELERALGEVAAALQVAHERGTDDPLGSLGAVVAADADLDAALAEASGAVSAARRVEAALATDLPAARAQVGAAEDFISTRRGGVGAAPRAQLAEARRRLGDAERLAAGDPSAALGEARAAADLGARALASARADVDRFTGGGYGGGYGGRGGSTAGQVAGSVLGGILIGGLLGGGGGPRSFGGGGGGFGGGGGLGGGGGGQVGGGRF